MSLTATLQPKGASAYYTTGQTFTVLINLLNSGSGTVNLLSVVPWATSNGQPYSGAVMGTVPNSPQASYAMPAGATLQLSYGVVLMAPQGSAENAGAQTLQQELQAVVLGVNITTDEPSGYSATITITPQPLGTAAPAAMGNMVFSSPLNAAFIPLLGL